MDKAFKKRLTGFLESECDDYEMSFAITKDAELVSVEITRYGQKVTVYFIYDESEDDIEIEVSEGVYQVVREYDYSVKHFWILVSPALFPNN